MSQKPEYKETSSQMTEENSHLLHRIVRYKLWRVNLTSNINPYNGCYVVAEDCAKAYAMVRKDLDERDYGFLKDRELKSIELIAEAYEYTNTPVILLLPNERDKQ